MRQVWARLRVRVDLGSAGWWPAPRPTGRSSPKCWSAMVYHMLWDRSAKKIPISGMGDKLLI